jgi:hypothetical protein
LSNLAKAGSLGKGWFHEILDLGRAESSVDHARDSDGGGRNGVSHNRAIGANARSVLVRNRDLGCHAINLERNADAFL